MSQACTIAGWTAYHLGYPEFEGVQVLVPVVSHIAMHIAAVLYGLYTAI